MADDNDIPVSVGHNRRAAIAADIRALHAGIRRSAEHAARDTIEAGKLLIEAKAGLAHGEWENWLRQNCDLSARTARRYMTIARSGLEPAIVADLGLTAAATAMTQERLQIARLRRLGRSAWRNLLEIGRHFGAVRDTLGDEQFRAWAPEATGFVADEALLLVEAAHVTDAGGDIAALLARDDVPKTIHFPKSLVDAAGEPSN
ncbi:Protein of unknown function [Rhizobiales bacterium GAS113]|nr:Protein of unknown function [Rhizobiales bacterium GAS113]